MHIAMQPRFYVLLVIIVLNPIHPIYEYTTLLMVVMYQGVRYQVSISIYIHIYINNLTDVFVAERRKGNEGRPRNMYLYIHITMQPREII